MHLHLTYFRSVWRKESHLNDNQQVFVVTAAVDGAASADAAPRHLLLLVMLLVMLMRLPVALAKCICC